MSDIAIKVENVSKKYQIGENKTYPTLRDKLMELPNRLFKGPKKTKEFWALKDVSFEIKKGEVVGIIGRNGAGKSTMLKILARITEPTSGKITMYGRVASMLEVGTGFNPELTGRENIYLNGAIIGMKKSEINSKFNDIVEFSGVGKFLDTPVKHYSSGMYVRLAFAVAAHLDADILLVDEVLAVGDAEFQKKCLGKMSDLAKSGRTVILVSHNALAIKSMCDSCLYLKDNRIQLFGPVNEVMAEYQNIGSSGGSNNPSLRFLTKEVKSKNVYIKKVSVTNTSDTLALDFVAQEKIVINIHISTKSSLKYCVVWQLIDDYNSIVAVGSSYPMNKYIFNEKVRQIRLTLNPQSLIPGKYQLRLVLHYPGIEEFDSWENCITLNITNNSPNHNAYSYPGIWSARQYVEHDWKVLE